MPPKVNLNQTEDQEMYGEQPTNPVIGTTITKPKEAKELRINLPKPLNGNQSYLSWFIQDCALYLKINESVYENDDKHIAFMLSLLDSGEPAMWKEQYLNLIMRRTTIYFPTFEGFLKQFKKAFKDVDQVNEAMNELGRIWQGNRGAEEHTTTFWFLVGKAGIATNNNPNHLVLIDLYQKSLKPAIVKKIMSMENIPNTIEEWYKKAILFDNNWRCLMTAMGRNPQYNSGQGRNYQNNTQNWDPDAMDIDAMSPEQQKLIKKGKCFNCKKPGHRSRDCDQPQKRKFSQNNNQPLNNRSSNDQSSSSKPQFKTAQEAHMYIQSIVNSLPDKEASKVMDIAEEEGF